MKARDVFARILNLNGNPATPPWQGDVPLTSSTILQALGLWSGATSVTAPAEAMGIAAAARATSILASTVAGASKSIYNRDTGQVDNNNNLLRRPHPLMNEFIFFEQMMLSLIYHGNFYARMQFDGLPGDRAAITSLTPIDARRVTPKAITRGSGARAQWVDILYVVDSDDDRYGIPADEIFHVAGLGFDGLAGVSLLSYARTVFESGLASETFANKFYGDGLMLSGVLTTDKRLDETAATGLKQRWRERVQGLRNAFDIVVLDSGTTFTPISINPADAQWLESRQFNVAEMARVYGVHPSLLMDTTMASLDPEALTSDFVAFTLNGWTRRIESAWEQQLLPPTYGARIATQRLVTPNLRTRSSAAVMWRKAQVKSINDLRDEEGLTRVDDARADDPFYITPAAAGASVPGTNQGNEPPPPDTATQEPGQQAPGDENE